MRSRKNEERMRKGKREDERTERAGWRQRVRVRVRESEGERQRVREGVCVEGENESRV